MDAFGIGIALQAMARNYFQMMRGQGRTTSLLAELKDGDRVIFANHREAERVKRLAREAGLDIDCRSFDPRQDPYRLAEMGTPKGRLVFDHTWLEGWYGAALVRATEDIDFAVNQFGGRGKQHIETRLAAVERSRWD